VIHAHSSKAGALARALVWLGVRQPVFYTPHAYYGLSGKGGMKSRVFNAIETVLGRVGTTINLSEGERAFARDSLKIPQARLRLIANPVDCVRFRPADAAKRKEIRAALGVPADAILLGSVGRLAFQKDPITLYHAFAKACQKGPSCGCIIWARASFRLSVRLWRINWAFVRALCARLTCRSRCRFIRRWMG
jgi:glycosyltransferase involved in cell wall biosynthesis